MNAKQAKDILICDYLDSLGISPSRSRTNGIWYHSPISGNDKTPSLQVSRDGRAFHDWSTGAKGNIIDLVIALGHAQSFDDALHVLALANVPQTHRSVAISLSSYQQQSPYEVIYFGQVKSRALLRWAHLRKISLPTIDQFLNEVRYIYRGREYYGFGWRNEMGGIEMRNSIFKCCLGRKGLTVVGDLVECKMLVFEGYFDFLSAVELGYFDVFHHTAIVLNSVSMVSHAVEILKLATCVECWLDNDSAGRNALTKLTGSGLSILDRSNVYSKSKDLNDYLMKKF